MFDPSVAELLTKAMPSMPHIVMERELKHDIDELVSGTLPPMKLAIVDDKDTAEAFGERIFRALKGRFPCTHVTLKAPHADDQTVQYLRTQTLSADALVAVGSGTINDLCKYVSHLDRKPYVVFPTAASMNGYLSANASITSHGHKKTVLAFMPQAVYCDLSVIANAPVRLNQSGIGDSLARPTAQADWLLSHLLLDTHYDDTPFKLLAGLEPQLFEQARGIMLGDVKSVELLIKILLLSGIGMTIAGGSYPASQGEHMIAHTYEMGIASGKWLAASKKSKAHPALHGEMIGVTSLLMAKMQEELLRGTPLLRGDDFNTEQMITLIGSEAAIQSRKAFDGKYALIKHSQAGDFLKRWDDVAEKLRAVTVPSMTLQKVLREAEAPQSCEALGWAQKDFDLAVSHARYTRERFTFLDII